MRRLQHPNCIRLYAILDEPETDGKLYLVIEYAARGATMEWDSDKCTYYVPETRGLVPETLAQQYVFDILQGLAYLHGCLIAHRDIKPQNLLVNVDGHVQIGDFGVAIQMGEDCLISGTEGTYYFYAPETCRGSGYEGHDGRKADVWATGVTLWAFLFGTMPFFHLDLVRLLESIGEAKYELPASPVLGAECQRILLQLLAPEPERRPLCLELLEDPWCRCQARRPSHGATPPMPKGDISDVGT